MKQWVGYVLLALSLVIAYQGWANSAKVAETQSLAESVACDLGEPEPCTLVANGMAGYKSDVIARHYQWQSTRGPVHVTCKRAWLFFGTWSCRSELGAM
jgi:hypothetical protein